MILAKSICYFGLDAFYIIAKVHLILLEHYILGIFFKLKVFSVFLFQASIILLLPFLYLFRVLLICEHNFFCFFSYFRYLTERKILNGISYVISAGSSVAIVGTWQR